MEKISPEIILIFTRMAHHSLHSGYDQLAGFINCRVRDQTFIYRIMDLCPEPVLARIRASAGSWYNSHALKQELQNVFDFVLKSSTIFHFLYGEDGYHYSGYLNFRKTNKVVATFHMPPEKFRETVEDTKHLKKLDAAIIIAPNQENIFKNVLDEKKVHLIPHGVNTQFFCPSPSAVRQRKSCLFVGTHLRDFKMLRNIIISINRVDPEVSFKIVTHKNYFYHLAGLKNVQMYSGVTEDILLNLYNTAELMLLPLIDCTACNSILEAMACGLPVISTRVGGVEMYTTDISAVLVDPGDSDRFAYAAMELLNSPDVLKRMSAGSVLAAEKFDWMWIAKQMMTVYRKII